VGKTVIAVLHHTDSFQTLRRKAKLLGKDMKGMWNDEDEYEGS